MRTIQKFDKWLLLLGFLIVAGIFTLAFVLYFKGGLCATDPIAYAINNNITIPIPQGFQIQVP